MNWDNFWISDDLSDGERYAELLCDTCKATLRGDVGDCSIAVLMRDAEYHANETGHGAS